MWLKKLKRGGGRKVSKKVSPIIWMAPIILVSINNVYNDSLVEKQNILIVYEKLVLASKYFDLILICIVYFSNSGFFHKCCLIFHPNHFFLLICTLTKSLIPWVTSLVEHPLAHLQGTLLILHQRGESNYLEMHFKSQKK